MRKVLSTIVLLTIFGMTANISAGDLKVKKNHVQRKAIRALDVQKNTLSNFEFYSSNYGILGHDIANNKGSGIWPRGSQNLYLFGGGFWFGAMKVSPQTKEMTKYVTLSYNPNNGTSWFIPGSVQDGDTLAESLKDKNRVYISTDFDQNTGEAFNPDDGPDWPLWIDDTTGKYEYGTPRHIYANNISERNKNAYPYGPMFVSDEDIFSIFKDSDLDRYQGGAEKNKALGYPLGLEVQSRIYSWDSDEMKDVVIQSYLIKNVSGHDLKNCWVGGVYDVDIAYLPDAAFGAGNDHTKYFEDDSGLNLAVGWTDTNRYEKGRGFGYIGISLLESPAVDQDGFIRKDKYIFEPQEQLGLKTYRNWPIQEDAPSSDERYGLLSSGIRDGDTGPSDVRMLLATGPFNMKAGDVARIAVAITFALPAKGGEADGTFEDLTGFKKGKVNIKDKKPLTLAYNNSLVGKLKRTRDEYYTMEATSVDDGGNNTGSRMIGSVYPNPADNMFNISYNLKKQGQIRLSLYNQLGQEIALIADGPRDAGFHSERFSLNRNIIENGVYYLRLQSGQVTETRKIVITR